MSKYKLIPGVENKIKEKISQLRITTEKPFEFLFDPKHHTFTIPCKIKNEKLIFKSLIVTDEKKRESFIKEFYLVRSFNQINLVNDFFYIPKMATGDVSGKFKWMLREFKEAEKVGDFWSFDKNFYSSENISLLVNSLILLQKITNDLTKTYFEFSKNKLEKRGYQWYKSGFLKDHDFNVDFIYSEFISLYLTKKEIKKLNYLIKSNSSGLNNSNYFNHGDLISSNLLKNYKDSKIVLVDLEEAHLNNPFFDLAFIWTNSWNSPIWRKKIISKFFDNFSKNNYEIDLFRICAIRLCLRMATYAHLNLVHKKKKVKNALKIYISSAKEILKGNF